MTLGLSTIIFWFFAFERFNAIQGQLPICRSPNDDEEIFISRVYINPQRIREDFESLLSFDRGPVGTVVSTLSTPENISLPHSFTRSVLDCSAMDQVSVVNPW